ncbi:hypothetical protein RJ639_041177 [Escallonia herrerae]|uniref:Translocation and assembly module TamB C-terminal domain-containing protein n=1 Tax=Escallonia herrerae TaxID=1293975 RepID=A0AA88WH63_9ASTE|nr:hypothetical protein RJ639_041177 [Escallonia herrerae]
MSIKLDNPFLGIPLQCSINGRKNNGNSIYLRNQVKIPRRGCQTCIICCGKKDDWIAHGVRFSHFCGTNVELLWKNLGLRSGFMVKCVKEPFVRSKALVRSLTPVWEEGLLLFRCSVFCAVISGICLLVWYGQSKAKSFMEAKLLPSVCAALSDYIEREIDFGRVRRISPLSITLESCSIGPHSEEFSCGDVPAVKLRVLPFTSLRRGKIVVDAVLSNPTVLVVQKKDYTWLGLPFSEESLQRHLSTEEGIDHRTKTRRVAREEAARQMSRERDNAAKDAAEMGYIVSDGGSGQSEANDILKEGAGPPTGLAISESVFAMDERLHWRDHHCMDAGVEYDMKHADLEKSFGVNIPVSGVKFWSKIIPGPIRHKFKRKANGRDTSATTITAKRKILERSASAAHAYFVGLSKRSFYESTRSLGDYNVVKLEGISSSSEDNPNGSEEHTPAEKQRGAPSVLGDQIAENGNRDVDDTGIPGMGVSKVKNHTKDTFPCKEDSGIFKPLPEGKHIRDQIISLSFLQNPFVLALGRVKGGFNYSETFTSTEGAARAGKVNTGDVSYVNSEVDVVKRDIGSRSESSRQGNKMLGCLKDTSKSQGGHTSQGSTFTKLEDSSEENRSFSISPLNQKPGSSSMRRNIGNLWSSFVVGPLQRLQSEVGPKVEDIVAELVDGVDRGQPVGIEKVLPVTLDSVHFKGGTLMLLAYGDKEPRQMENASGYVKFQNQYGRLHVQLGGSCKKWRSDVTSEDGGWLSTDVFVDTIEQKWHANLKVVNLFVPLFERILEIPIMWSEGRASGEVHICMSRGETFPNLHGQLDATGLAFQDLSASLCFRGQRIFLHNASGWFGSIPLEASGDFGIEPEEGEFHLMCQVPSVEVNSLMKTFKMKPLLFSCAGSVTAVFNCQGPLDAPIFVGSGLVSRKLANAVSEIPSSVAYEAMMKNKEAELTFAQQVADLYGIRASLVDGGEIRGAGNAWICPEGEEDETAMDSYTLVTFDTRRFDIKWTAPKAEGSFGDARGDIIISHDYITVSSSSVAFELFTKVQTSYRDEDWLKRREYDVNAALPVIVEGVDLDLRLRGFEFFSLVSSYAFDNLRPTHLKATGRIKFQGKVIKPFRLTDKQVVESGTNMENVLMKGNDDAHSLAGEVSISGLKLNQLMLAPQLAGLLHISRGSIKLDASGRPDESLAVELVGPLQPSAEENTIGKVLSFSLQKGHLRANICYRPLHSANLEAELQLNFQKRRGHGVLSVLQPKFSGVLGEALDVAARWSGDVITVEKAVLEQSNSQYELQGEYVLPGTRDRYPAGKERGSLFRRAMAGHLSTVISSMGRWRMRLEVPRAEIAEMLPLARLVSRSTDPAVQSRSKDLFLQSLQSVGVYGESLQKLLEEIRGYLTASEEVILEDLSLPGLAELKGRWRGSLDASGGGNGDTMAEFDFQGDEWEWGAYKTQRVIAAGAYSNDDGLRLEKIFIQKDNATIHADGTLLGPKTNLHFAVLNFPVSLVPTLVQVIESSASDSFHSLRQFLAPIKGILHMEGDLRGSLVKPECDVQVRLLDGAIGGIDLGRAEIVASLTSASRFLFNAKFEPIIQNGHVHVKGSIPVNFVESASLEEESLESEKTEATWIPGWAKGKTLGSADEASDKKASRDRNEEGWDTQLAESLKGLNWNLLDVGEVRVDADIKDGGMMLLTALSPYANWLQGNAEVMLQVRGTVEQPLLDGSASFHKATISSPVLRKPLTNFGGTVLVNSNSGQVDSQLQVSGSILQPNISGKIKLSHGEAYLPHDKGGGPAPISQNASNQSRVPSGGYNQVVASKYVSRFLNLKPAVSSATFHQSSGKQAQAEKEMGQISSRPTLDIRLTDLKLLFGPELRIVYPLILNFAVSGEVELNGIAHPKWIKPKGILTFENGDVNLVATQVRLKREHLNIAKFEPDNGLDPMLDLALVGSEWQFRIQGRASKWQDSLVVTSTRSVEQDVLTPTEAARVFQSQLAESILEGDGQLAFKKLATATLETLMPRIEGKGEFKQARWRLVYAPQIPSLLSVDPSVDPLKSLASNISFGTEVEVQLGKRLQASIVRQMKDSEMAMQWTLIYQLTSRLRVLLQSAPSKRLLFEYSTTSQD